MIHRSPHRSDIQPAPAAPRTAPVQKTLSFPNLLLFAALIIGFGIRSFAAAKKQTLEYDEGISILAATGHEREYYEISEAHLPPIGVWSPAAEWQRLTEIETGRGFSRVAQDLAFHDIHPPLYFWALHAWISAFGSSLSSSHFLNLLLDLTSALVLMRLAHQIFQDSTFALLAGAIWVLSPIAIKTAYWMRPYSFLTLIVLLYAAILFNTLRGSLQIRRLAGSSVWLGLVILAGMLTHYYFAFYVLIGLGLISVKLLHSLNDRRVPVLFALVLIGAGLLFLLSFRDFSYSLFGFLTSQFPLSMPLPEMVRRMLNAAKTSLLMFSPILAASGLLLARALLGSRGMRSESAKGRKPGTGILGAAAGHPVFRWTVLLAGAPFLIVLLLYAAGISEVHTFSSRYLGFITPFMALAAAMLVFSVEPRGRQAALMGGGMIILGLLTLTPGLAQTQEGSLDRLSLRSAPRVVIDTVQYGAWPGIVQLLDRGQQVYLDSQENLVAHPQAWLSGLGEEGGIYVSVVRGRENTPAGRKRILEILAARYRVEELSRLGRSQDWEIAVYRLIRSEPP